jgi:type II secretory pathway pseudopilin PulG
MKRRRLKPGFTLVELIIGILMTALLMSAISIVVATAMKGYELSNDATEQTQLIRNTLERISREIRTASQVTWSSDQLVIDPGASQITYSVSSNQLVYTKSSSSVALLGPNDGISVTSMAASFLANADEPTKTLLVKVTINYTDLAGNDMSVNVSASPRKNHIK